jgi:hypothetical protein
MPFVTKQEARDAASRATQSRVVAKSYGAPRPSATEALRERADTTQQEFDVFLSHSHKDAELVLGAAKLLEERGLTVYVDWVTDREPSGTLTTAEHARMVKERMGQSGSLLYIWTDNSMNSRWTPWEIGYFDALRGKVAVFPLLDRPNDTYKGAEYLGLYPAVKLESDVDWRMKKAFGSAGFSSGPRALVEGGGVVVGELRSWAPRPQRARRY